MASTYVFGPVSSGRLGRSLGLDLLGAPVCSMDCLYCEVGATRALTTTRKPWVRAEAILDELAAWKAEGHPDPDHVTLGGMGEPCLNTDLGRIIEGARAILPGVPVAVLTNSTLLADPQVRRDLALADVVLPSLDSLVEEEFAALNRPAPGLTARAVAEALLDFGRGFSGSIFLEVLLAAGINDSAANLVRLCEFVSRLRPERVDVTTLSRPGAHSGASAVDSATLGRWREALDPERFGDGKPVAGTDVFQGRELTCEQIREIITGTLERRPQTLEQLTSGLGIPQERVRQVLEQLLDQGRIIRMSEQDRDYFAAAGRRSG